MKTTEQIYRDVWQRVAGVAQGMEEPWYPCCLRALLALADHCCITLGTSPYSILGPSHLVFILMTSVLPFFTLTSLRDSALKLLTERTRCSRRR